MKIVIAPQAFKGCASARNVAQAIAQGVRRAFPNAEIMLAPVADGGNDTLDVLLDAKGGERHHALVSDAFGEKKLVKWGILHQPSSTAVIELARICGLADVPLEKCNPLLATTFGVGEAILAAMEAGCRTIFVGLGGSATNDGGSGAARALGVKFLNVLGDELPPGGAALAALEHIDISGLDPRLQHIHLIAGCDVINPLLGPQGATAVFSPQKGAAPPMVAILEHAMQHFAEIIHRQFGIDVRDLTYGGAAGGAAAGMHALLNAELVSGCEWILKEIGFDHLLDGCDLVIVGEGRMDFQTVSHKAPWVVAQAAKARQIPVIAITGSIGQGYESMHTEGIDAIFPLSFVPQSTHQFEHALGLIAEAAEEAVRCWHSGNI